MRRCQFETYLDRVFDWSSRVAALPEGRLSPRHPWPMVFDSVFLGGALNVRLALSRHVQVLLQKLPTSVTETSPFLARVPPTLLLRPSSPSPTV